LGTTKTRSAGAAQVRGMRPRPAGRWRGVRGRLAGARRLSPPGRAQRSPATVSRSSGYRASAPAVAGHMIGEWVAARCRKCPSTTLVTGLGRSISAGWHDQLALCIERRCDTLRRLSSPARSRRPANCRRRTAADCRSAASRTSSSRGRSGSRCPERRRRAGRARCADGAAVHFGLRRGSGVLLAAGPGIELLGLQHQFDLFAALLTERVEERKHRLAVASRSGPHEPAPVMVDHDGEVALAFSVADLVGLDPPQPVERIDLSCRFVVRRSESPTTGRAPRQGRWPVDASAAVSGTTRHRRGRRTRRRTPRGPDSCRGRGWFRVA
jgi:hypothetical protein